jgi:hypothetical protein
MIATLPRAQSTSPTRKHDCCVPTTINAAFFYEIKCDNSQVREALETLERRVNSPMQLQPSYQIVSALARLREQLRRQFFLEESYGYFHDPVVVDLTISLRAESLQAEHAELIADIEEILDHAEYVAGDDTCRSLWSQVVRRVYAFCEQLKEHERDEYDLIRYTYH